MSSGIPPWRASASATATTAVYPSHATPAYIPVQARRSLTTPASTSATPAPQPKTTAADAGNRKRVEWPEPVRKYVQRCFAPENQISGVSRQEMEAKLRSVITEAAQSDVLDKINWEAQPLPQVMVQNDKLRILTNPEASTWGTPFAAQSPKRTASDDASRKRKSAEYQTESNACPPWRQTNKSNVFEDRVTYSPTDKRQRIESKNSNIRPLPVLMKTLDLLKKKWKKDNNYTYICDQFKSLRQDLTVQHIRNEFTVSVYEIHARIALEKGDLGEYNQCQTQLRALYAQQLGGHPTEFKAYRILYFIHTRNWTAMNDALADLIPADKRSAAVKHALDVRSALALGNYHRFFQLYLATPNMGAYLMDMFVDRERLSALSAICKAYKPDVKIRFITEELGFESDEQSARFILDHSSEDMLLEKDGSVRLLTGGKAAQLFEAAKADAHRVIDIKGQI
ncbi:hypothetical protein AN7031.2 [Aspergillus nidulans FGSC A4]|uniref:SAC3/GANP domain protein (AFU_orthologue AFUA_4G04110) n=1 Tax=Emericella nidulans (strain FGSC A4 / ATCC 38163 / CBS 112.46 / NRRL 194 / M139) TaxID=227321 RepID=Q5AXE9_EMENI|nr:hypothetical protein [Aspergillus nidulans FGSC A4]EAA61677.1 hypothetical protein AN7031.2 [Aspergillus nidulans FGSC A4]CBF79222.1 TPA: SAC3/GANP domain protein (AFU_orthologue; AFUA_4G04110) [Aspergillus nidulans FGSC A4]|eukprot:XP_664635.1 hypothetical protein AN7031.2 [Aspergillus nidulans FGSC A4]